MPRGRIASRNPVRLKEIVIKQFLSNLAEINGLSIFLEIQLVGRRAFALAWVFILLSHYLAYTSEVAMAF